MRDSTITNQLRSAKQFTLIFAKTNEFKNSFIPCMTFIELDAIYVCYYVYTVLYLIQPLDAMLQERVLYCNKMTDTSKSVTMTGAVYVMSH